MIIACRFLLDLHQANDARTPSSPSALPELNFAAFNSRHSRTRTQIELLPPFIAPMGSLIHMPESPSEDVAQTDKSASHDETLSQWDEEPETSAGLDASV